MFLEQTLHGNDISMIQRDFHGGVLHRSERRSVTFSSKTDFKISRSSQRYGYDLFVLKVIPKQLFVICMPSYGLFSVLVQVEVA